MIPPIEPTLQPWTAIVGFILGALAGSFLNMLIWRLPRGKSLVDPAHSICPICGHELSALDLMPILSWVRTKGKCRHCGAPIAVRYLLVELLVGALFAVFWVQKMCVGFDPQVVPFAAYAAAAAILVAIIFIDGELYIIPDELNAALLFVGLAYGGYLHHFREAVLGALLGWGLIWGFVLLGRLAFGKDAMGDGDIKMMRGVGALLGPTLLLANVGLGVILGLIGGIAMLAVEARKDSKAKGSPPPTPSSSPDEATGPIGDVARGDEEGTPEATPIPLVFLSGAIYLFCIDVIALFFPSLAKAIAAQYPPELVNEEDDWEPSATAIPFGPYLAVGALVCMLAGDPIEQGLRTYWEGATGGARIESGHSGRTPRNPSRGLPVALAVEQTAQIRSLLPRDGQV